MMSCHAMSDDVMSDDVMSDHTEGLEKHPPLHGHGCRHGEDQLVTLRGGHHGKPDAYSQTSSSSIDDR